MARHWVSDDRHNHRRFGQTATSSMNAVLADVDAAALSRFVATASRALDVPSDAVAIAWCMLLAVIATADAPAVETALLSHELVECLVRVFVRFAAAVREHPPVPPGEEDCVIPSGKRLAAPFVVMGNIASVAARRVGDSAAWRDIFAPCFPAAVAAIARGGALVGSLGPVAESFLHSGVPVGNDRSVDIRRAGFAFAVHGADILGVLVDVVRHLVALAAVPSGREAEVVPSLRGAVRAHAAAARAMRSTHDLLKDDSDADWDTRRVAAIETWKAVAASFVAQRHAYGTDIGEELVEELRLWNFGPALGQ